MGRSARILRNIASNWVGFAINAAVTFLLTPFVLHQIGEVRYGVWVLTASIIGYYGLLDLGFCAGINQYLTRFMAMRDYGKANECISSAVVVLSMLGALLAVLSIVAAYIAPRAFDVAPDMEHEAFWCIVIIGFSSALQFPFFPFMAVFTATQRFDVANLIGVGTRLLTAGGIYAALSMGYGLIGISAAMCGASLIDYLIRWRVAYRLAPKLEVSRRQVNLARLREIGSFGGWNFLTSVSFYLELPAQTLLIGSLMSIAAVGHYALAASLWQQIKGVLSPVGQVLYPVATELYVRGERTALERLYHDGSRLMLLATVCIVLVALFWAEDFYRLWIGEKYLSGTPFPSVALLLQILLIGAITSYVPNIAGQIMLGAGRVRLLATLVICRSVLNLTLSLILIQTYGLAGVAAAAVIASVLVDLIAIPLALQRTLGLRVKDFLRGACARPVLVGVLLATLMVCIRYAGQPRDWFHMILHGVFAGASAAAVVLMVGVTAEERQRFLVDPIRRLLRRNTPAANVSIW